MPARPARPPRRRRLARAGLVTVLVGAASTAWSYSSPVPTSPTPPPPVSLPIECAPVVCGAPSAANCADQRWVTSCAAQYGATNPSDPANPCYGYNLQSWNGNTASATSGKVFLPEQDDFAAAQVMPETTAVGMSSQCTAETPPIRISFPTEHDSEGNTWAALENKAQFEALKASITPGSETSYVRKVLGVITPGKAMVTCDAYVYRSFYDVERWIDAMNACKGDARCVVTVSLNGLSGAVPGIARRTLRDNEGTPISVRLSELAKAHKVHVSEVDPFTPGYTLQTVPKNAFYANGEHLITQKLIDAFAASGDADLVQALENELHRGALYYVTSNAPQSGGKPFLDNDGPHRGFYDEWDFHNTMNQWTAGVSDGEFREYRRRNDDVLRRWDLLADEVKCVLANVTFNDCNPHTMPSALGKVWPGDTQMWQNDPFAARSIINSITPTEFVAPPILNGQIGYGDQLQTSALSFQQVQSATTLLSGSDLVGSSAHLPGMVQLSPVPLFAQIAMTGTGAKTMSAQLSAPTRTLDAAATATIPIGGIKIPPAINIDGWADFHAARQYDPDKLDFTLDGVLNRMWAINPPKIDHDAAYPRLDCRVPRKRVITSTGSYESKESALVVDDIMHTDQIWQDACEMIDVYLDEWGRQQMGKPSCLDWKHYQCDWSPKDFVDRFVTKNVGYAAAAKEVEYHECLRWTGGNLSNPWPVGMDIADQTTLQKVRDYFAEKEARLEGELKKVPVLADDTFGTQRQDSESIGNSTFGGGYSYDLGWQLALNRQNYCQSSGHATAAFEAHGSLFGVKVPVLDALATASANEGPSGTSYVNSHLRVFDYALFDTRDDARADSAGRIAGAYSKQSVDGDHIQIFQVPFQIAWVTVTISAGLDYLYGANAALGVTGSSGCDPSPKENKTLLTASASFTPFAQIGVWVDADASIAGIAGVGLEVDLTLVGLSLPLTAKLELTYDQYKQLLVTFETGLDLVLNTLKGELDFYIEAVWTKVASFTLLKWDGFTHRFPIFRTPKVSLPVGELPSPVVPVEELPPPPT